MKLIESKYDILYLNDVSLDMHQGINTVTEKVQYLESGIPIIQTKNITSGFLDLENVRYLSEEDYKKYKEKYQPGIGNVLISNIGTIGRALEVKIEYPFLIAWNLFLIKLKEEKILPQYLFHYFEYLLAKRYYDRLLTGGTVKFISKKIMGKIPIPLPPLAEQKRIAKILDQADQLRQLNQQVLEQYDALTQSLFLDMFGDIGKNKKFPICILGDLTEIVRDGPHVSPRYSETGIPILSTRNIRPYEVVLDQVKFVSKEMHADLTKRFKPKKGDVLLTKGGTTGFAKVVDWEWEFCIWVHLAAIRLNQEKANPKYIEAALNSFYCYQQSQRYTRGIANKDLGLKRMIKIELPLPPLTLQNKFAEKIKSIEAQKASAKTALANSEDLFNSLLQKAFKGEL